MILLHQANLQSQYWDCLVGRLWATLQLINVDCHKQQLTSNYFKFDL